MKKIKDFVKKNYKVAISFVLGMIVCIGIGVSAVATKDVVYDNSKSGLTSTNLQGAIDELNTKATTKIKEAEAKCPDGYKCIKQVKNIVDAYTYNQTSGASNYCVTGEESTCVQTSCYENKTLGSCPAGTIIKYKVNDTTEKYFYVLHDDGATLTVQQRETYTYSAWYLIGTDYENSSNLNGPITALSAVESATEGWTNVNDQTYTMGTTVFKTNKFTGCSSYNSCTTNKYTLGKRTAKARMITVQEATAVGCTDNNRSCPIWMYNYMNGSTSYGGTNNSYTETGGDYNYVYWTMSADSTTNNYAWSISCAGKLQKDQTCTPNWTVRIVVNINK